jgi:Glycosyltransferase family 87
MRRATGQGGGLSARRQLTLIAVIWLVTRLALLQDLGWLGRTTSYEDVSVYRAWATQMVHTHQLPAGTSWQYPVGAALLFLLAELGPAHYDRTFCLLMLACDLGITATLATLSYRERRFQGVWAWLLATTAFGPIILLRFDLAPTLALVVGLAVLWDGRRVGLFGALIGVGVLVKVWPLLALVAARTWRELGRAVLWCAATVVIVTGAASIYFGDTFGFLSNQAGRGLEVDSVAASPWFLRDAFTGKPLPFRFASGATDLTGGGTGTVASVLHILMVLAALLIAGWWLTQMQAGRLASPELARDTVLTALLWYLVISPVLSPQYFIWVIGLGALLLCSPGSQMQRPLILLAVTLVLTRALMQSGPQLYATHRSGALTPTTITCLGLVARNIMLLLAAVEATRVTLTGKASR